MTEHCRVAKSHGKGPNLHGNIFAVRTRTANVGRQRSTRQRIFAVRFGQYARQKDLCREAVLCRALHRFAVRSPLPCAATPLPCVAPLPCTFPFPVPASLPCAERLCRARLFAVRSAIAVKGALPCTCSLPSTEKGLCSHHPACECAVFAVRMNTTK